MTLKLLKNPWDLIASQYDEQFGNEGDYSHKFIIHPALLDILGNIENKEILDLGCGTGTFSRILARKKSKVIGTDYSKEMISIALDKQDEYKFPSEYYISDARKDFNFKDKSFDYILQIMLLHSIGDKFLKNILSETFRTLRDNGECLIVIPHPFFTKEFKSIGYPIGDLYLSNYKTYFVWKQFNEICKSPTEFYLRPLEYYADLFESTGFVIKKIYEPKIVNTKEALNAKPHMFIRRREIPGFMIIKLVKLLL